MKTMSTGSRNRRNALLSEINVTPFVDITLVLLIIFMLTAPMLQQGIGVSLPQTKPSGAQVEAKPFILNIKKDSNIYIGDQPIRLNELSDKLKAIFAYKKRKLIYLQADKTIPYGFVAQTLGEIKFSGIEEVSLITSLK